MKKCFTIGLLLFVTTQTFAQNLTDTDIEAINFYVSNNPPKENERLVNEMYLQKANMGYESFSPMQIQILYNIAHQCPDIGGTAVYRARSIYALIGYDTYDDDCDNLPQARMENISSVDSCYSEVHFLNPSLEDTPWFEKVPTQWDVCEGTPNVEPFFTYSIPPSDGNSYASIYIWSPPNYHEAFGQELGDTLFANTNYGFLFDLATPYSLPGAFSSISIWLGDSFCKKQQLIYTITTQDTFWRTCPVIFTPNNNYTHIVFIEQNVSANYIDNIRPIPQPLCDTITSITTIPPDRTDNTGDGVYTDITVSEPTEFKVYPNPNIEGILIVEWTTPIQNGKLVLIDAVGRQVGQYVVENQSVSQQIDIQTLPSGYYTILLESDKQVWGREKLIVIKQ